MNTIFPYFYVIIESCFALFLGGLGIFLIISAQGLKPDVGECQSWRKSEGVIIEAEIISECDPKGKINYIPVVQFIFQANHRMVQGSQICTGRSPHFTRQQKALQNLENYPLGSKVSVFFDPHNPEEAVLEGHIYDRRQCLILGSVFILLMIFLLGMTAFFWCFEHQINLHLIFK